MTLYDLSDYYCKLWDIYPPEIIIDKNIKNPYYQILDNKSFIFLKDNVYKEYHPILHELRHHYQFIKYNELYLFFITHPYIYQSLYKYPLCVLEEDANIFMYFNGKKDGECLLKLIDKKFIELAYRNIISNRLSIDYYIRDIKKYEIINNISEWRHNRKTVNK